ncbi:hypothetical protein [Cohnella sp. GCM10012308]|uniref:hypothetical protein n=1 Tax=Cohnella sp. GCM10012308 TaxID=3317329 RepID=UPI00361F979A
MKLNNKLITTAMCLSIVLSSFSGVFQKSKATENSEYQLTESNATLAESQLTQPSGFQAGITTKQFMNNEVITNIESIRLGQNATQAFSLEADEMEQMLEKGYGIEDIFKVNEVANQFALEPKDLIALKSERKDWDQVKNELLAQKLNSFRKELRSSLKDDYAKIKKYKLTEEEEDLLLMSKRENEGLSVEAIMTTYAKQPGTKSMKRAIEEKLAGAANTQKMTIIDSKTKKAMDVSDIPPVYLKKLKAYSEREHLDLPELIKKYRAEKQKQASNVKMYKEVK